MRRGLVTGSIPVLPIAMPGSGGKGARGCQGLGITVDVRIMRFETVNPPDAIRASLPSAQLTALRLARAAGRRVWGASADESHEPG
jgi:hypothetical protein